MIKVKNNWKRILPKGLLIFSFLKGLESIKFIFILITKKIINFALILILKFSEVTMSNYDEIMFK